MEDVQTHAAPGANGSGEAQLVMQGTQHAANGIENRIETSALRSSPHPVEGEDASITGSTVQSEPGGFPDHSRHHHATDGHIIKKEEAEESFEMPSYGTQSFMKGKSYLTNGIQSSIGDAGDTYGMIYDPDQPEPSLPLPLESHQIDDISFLDSAASIIESEAPRIQAFAKLEFDDGQFYMNTHAVELGRDIRAAKRALEQDLEASQDQEPPVLHRHRSNSSADMAHLARKLKREGSIKVASSVVSESGGIMNIGIQDTEPRKRPRSKKAKSESSSSRNLSRKNSLFSPKQQTDYQTLAEASLNKSRYGAHPVDALSLMPSPDECPLIPIHPPQVPDGGTAGHRGISRRHVRIAYNFDKRLFELIVIGRNGAFVDEHFYQEGRTAELRSGSFLQIGGVGVRFILPNVAIGETGAETTIESEALSAMSFDFEDGRGESLAMVDSESESSDSQRDTRSEPPETDGDRSDLEDTDTSDDIVQEQEEVEDAMDDDEDSDEGQEEQAAATIKKAQPKKKQISRPKEPPRQPKKTKLKLKFKLKQKPPPKAKQHEKAKEEAKAEIKAETLSTAIDLGIPASLIPPKRKGPGRPPKNGIMSKRQQALIQKQIKDEEKAKAIANGTLQPDKTKEVGDLQTERRKYTKRKKTESQPHDSSDVLETAEGPTQAGKPLPKPPKEKRAPKPPRSPSPVFDEAALTPEQLAKPQQSYVVLIHEALSSSKTGQMSLPQIYRAIERKYPYYKLRVTTVGWQSSVRHNLSQHPAFDKFEREGKGWMWGLVPSVSIEKERRKRASPPLMQPPNYYPPNSQPYRPPYPYAGMPPPPNGQMPPPMGHNPYMYALPPGQGFPPPGVVPRGLNNLPMPLAGPQNNASSTYQSPYTPTPQPQPQNQNQVHIPQSSSETTQSQPQPGTKSPSESTDTRSIADSQKNTPLVTQNQNQDQATQSPLPAGVRRASPHLSQIPAPRSQLPLPHYILDAVSKFKSSLMEKLSSTTQNAEEIITNAIDRTLGVAPSPNETPRQEDPQERPIMVALEGMLERLKGGHHQAASSGPPPSSARKTQSMSPAIQRVSQPPQPIQHAPELPQPNIMPTSGTPSVSLQEPKPTTHPLLPSESQSSQVTDHQPISASSTSASPPPPSSQTQQDQILSLLQQLGQKVPAPNPTAANSQSTTIDAVTTTNASTRQVQAQTLSKGIEAAEQVVGGPSEGAEMRGAKRRFEDEEGEKNELEQGRKKIAV